MNTRAANVNARERHEPYMCVPPVRLVQTKSDLMGSDDAMEDIESGRVCHYLFKEFAEHITMDKVGGLPLGRGRERWGELSLQRTGAIRILPA